MSDRFRQKLQAPTWVVLAAGVALNVGVVVAGAYAVFETKDSSANYRGQITARQDRLGEYAVKAVDGINEANAKIARLEGKVDTLLNLISQKK